MDSLDITGAPGCYGIGLLYKPASNECGTCPFGQTCGPKATEQLERLRAELGIVVPKRRTNTVAVAKPTAHPTGFATGMPKKVAELMERIERAGIKVTEALSKGENPFTTKPQFLRVTCHLLLKLPQGIKRDLLCTCFMQKLNWSKGTADAHVIQAVQYLKAIGAATESNGILQLRR